MWCSTRCKNVLINGPQVPVMDRRRTLLTACCTALLGGMGVPTMAQAQAPTAATLPVELGTELLGAQAAGTARMRYFGFNIYDATLWVTPGFRASTYARHGLALELVYLRKLDGRAIAERSLAEMQGLEAIAPAQARKWLSAMETAFPDVKAGDRLTGLHRPGIGARFWFNGQPVATVVDAEFSRLFFGIWLADATSEPALRRQLLASAAP